jgi:hypothetical protein
MIILAGCFDSTKFSNDKATNQSASGHNTKRPGKKQDIELPLITEHEQPPWQVCPGHNFKKSIKISTAR